ncbi:MAG: serine hydrolase [Candidatus Delongbacteria bacterium]|nr:serine hydrolase [Candidatus Delongbacteria bacterium]MBN2834831.1 serine hydrolase [Candidatus Delongbacteria bacterium]
MKNTIRFQIVFLLVLLISCQKPLDSEKLDSIDFLIGEWNAKFENDNSEDRFVFVFQKEMNNNVTGKIYTYQNDAKVMEMPICSIDLVKNILTLKAKSTIEILYKGEVSKNGYEIRGYLIFPDNEKKIMNLFRIDDKLERLPNNQEIVMNKQETEYFYKVPLEENDRLETASLESQSIETSKIEQVIKNIARENYGLVHSVIIIKNNKLVLEDYFNGYSKDEIHLISSITKSIASILIEILIDHNLLENENIKLSTIFTEHTELFNGMKSEITVNHLLNMTSGFQLFESELYKVNERIKDELARKCIYNAGEKFQYDPANANLLAGVIKNLSGIHADEFADKYLFKPLGIVNYDWEDQKQNDYPLMQGSLKLRPRDMAKIGLLIINKGKFDGKQILSENWVNKITNSKNNNNYSNMWWLGKSKINDKEFQGIIATGIGGQFIYIAPELNLVIVTTAGNFHNGKTMDIVRMIEDEILPSVIF